MRKLLIVAALSLAGCQHNTLLSWSTEGDRAEAITADHRLIGFGCGEHRLVMTAAEEDHFPTCDAIEAIEDVCPPSDLIPDDPVTAVECARYMTIPR
jgi:hypothetical protein